MMLRFLSPLRKKQAPHSPPQAPFKLIKGNYKEMVDQLALSADFYSPMTSEVYVEQQRKDLIRALFACLSPHTPESMIQAINQQAQTYVKSGVPVTYSQGDLDGSFFTELLVQASLLFAEQVGFENGGRTFRQSFSVIYGAPDQRYGFSISYVRDDSDVTISMAKRPRFFAIAVVKNAMAPVQERDITLICHSCLLPSSSSNKKISSSRLVNVDVHPQQVWSEVISAINFEPLSTLLGNLIDEQGVLNMDQFKALHRLRVHHGKDIFQCYSQQKARARRLHKLKESTAQAISFKQKKSPSQKPATAAAGERSEPGSPGLVALLSSPSEDQKEYQTQGLRVMGRVDELQFDLMERSPLALSYDSDLNLAVMHLLDQAIEIVKTPTKKKVSLQSRSKLTSPQQDLLRQDPLWAALNLEVDRLHHLHNKMATGVGLPNHEAGDQFMKTSADVLACIHERLPGLKFSTDALKACGMQLELGAHLAQQCKLMGVSIILRAGSPPVYNQRRGPKGVDNKTKTSNQGLFKGSIAAEQRFGRLDNGQGMDFLGEDALHLSRPVNALDYQHTVALPVTMQDLLREIAPEGDLRVLGYEAGQLRLAYKEGKGDIRGFHGQFVIDLMAGNPTPIFYATPWNRPENDPSWDKDKQVIRKPEALEAVPDEVYKAIFHHLFTVSYADHQLPEFAAGDLKIAAIFANTPKTSVALLEAIRSAINIQGHDVVLAATQHMDANTPRQDILNALTPEQIKAVYDDCALPVTGDWDGLALSLPMFENCPAEALYVYDTTLPLQDGVDPQQALFSASSAYLHFLKTDPVIQSSPLGELLLTIKPADLFDELAIKQAGCITAHEFVFQQLINFSWRDPDNKLYGEKGLPGRLQSSLDAGLKVYHQVKQDRAGSSTFGADDAILEQQCLDAALAVYEGPVDQFAERRVYSHQAYAPYVSEHLSKHLKIAIAAGGKHYVIPHLNYDPNVHNLFQHGPDMRYSGGSNLKGAWLMITSKGVQLYGDTQEQLAATFLVGDFLERQPFDISHGADMAIWGPVIARQLLFNQVIPDKTKAKYQLWLEQSMLNKEIKLDDLFLAEDTLNVESASSTRCDDEKKTKTKTMLPACSSPPCDVTGQAFEPLLASASAQRFFVSSMPGVNQDDSSSCPFKYGS